MGLILAIKHAETRILVSTFPSCLRTNSDKDTKDEQGINNRMQEEEVILIIIMKENEEETKIHQENKHGNGRGRSRREAATMSASQKPKYYAMPGDREADPITLWAVHPSCSTHTAPEAMPKQSC